jgi:phage/plasmid-like protein (TIGR03299 family)
MGHEITSTDGLILVRERAWHGLGRIIPEGIRPTESLPLIGAEWGIAQCPVSCTLPDGQQVVIPNTICNVRDDIWSPLGLVSPHYKVFSNRQVAEFCEALADEGVVKIETAGTIRGGKKVWFLLAGEPFAVRQGDKIVPYVLVSNGHDGLTSLRVTPTTIRVVCSNTLHAVIPAQEGSGKCQSAAIVIEHCGDLQSRVIAVRSALSRYSEALEHTRNLAAQLDARKVSQVELVRYFVDRWSTDFVAPAETEDPKLAKRRHEKMDRGLRMFRARLAFEEQVSRDDVTWWGALNAYTGMLQHDRASRGRDDADRRERRQESVLFGVDSARCLAALDVALELCV